MNDWITRRRKELGEFDVSSLTAVGWILFLLSIGVPLGLFLKYVDLSPGPPGAWRPPRILFLGLFLVMIGVYQGSRFLVEKAGLKVYRSKKPIAANPGSVEVQ